MKKEKDALDQERGELGEQFQIDSYTQRHIDPDDEEENTQQPWNLDGENFDEDNRWNKGEADYAGEESE